MPVGVFHKRGSGGAVGIQCHMGAPLQHALQRFFASTHDRVATNDEVGRRHADACGTNRVLVISNQHMAPSRATFLRQSCRVLRHDAFAFDVRSHSQ